MIKTKSFAKPRIVTSGDLRELYKMEEYLAKRGCTFHRIKGIINYIVRHSEFEIESVGSKAEDVKFEAILKAYRFFENPKSVNQWPQDVAENEQVK